MGSVAQKRLSVESRSIEARLLFSEYYKRPAWSERRLVLHETRGAFVEDLPCMNTRSHTDSGQGIHGKSGQLVVIIRLDEKDDAPNPAKVLRKRKR